MSYSNLFVPNENTIYSKNVNTSGNCKMLGELTIKDSVNKQLTLEYDTINFAQIDCDISGDLTLAATSGRVKSLNTFFAPLLVSTNLTSPQLSVQYDPSNVMQISIDSAGDATFDTSGNNINMHSNEVFTVLNTVDSTSTVTGGLRSNGGAGITKRLFAAQGNFSQATDPVAGMIEGDIIFNTTSHVLKVYNGSAWKSVTVT